MAENASHTVARTDEEHSVSFPSLSLSLPLSLYVFIYLFKIVWLHLKV